MKYKNMLWMFKVMLASLLVNTISCEAKKYMNDSSKNLEIKSDYLDQLDQKRGNTEMDAAPEYAFDEDEPKENLKAAEEILGIQQSELDTDPTSPETTFYNWVTYEKKKRRRLDTNNNLAIESTDDLNLETYIMQETKLVWPSGVQLIYIIIAAICTALVLFLMLSIIIILMTGRKREKSDDFDGKLKCFFQLLAMSIPKNLLKILKAQIEYC